MRCGILQNNVEECANVVYWNGKETFMYKPKRNRGGMGRTENARSRGVHRTNPRQTAFTLKNKKEGKKNECGRHSE